MSTLLNRLRLKCAQTATLTGWRLRILYNCNGTRVVEDKPERAPDERDEYEGILHVHCNGTPHVCFGFLAGVELAFNRGVRNGTPEPSTTQPTENKS